MRTVIPSGAKGEVEESDKMAFLTDPSASLGLTIKTVLVQDLMKQV
jgi:hypothetical protein